ncbi:MAG: hypothetical protein NWR45_00900 [Candidatus Nanopelagicales bacterium]|nr:hypothetical protein [Candidatus Nanopelagicales bacterium]
MSATKRASAVIGAGIIMGGLAGAALGVLWWQLAPRVPIVVKGDDVRPDVFQPEGFFAADVAFTALAVVAGLIVTIGLARMRREDLIGVLVAALLAGAIGTFVMWFVGTRLGSVDIEGLIGTTESEIVVDGPLTVSLPAAFVVWPLIAAITVTLLALGDWLSQRRSAPPSHS